ncbi:hypothetical protein ACFW2D_10065 [Streptomyces sp. NPDC058914]|uniref:hypothetical protein n=1 Tax=Streptomyces sp. NPDC058914 TaxID=3346671 RepID=UPI0036B7EE0C
MTALDDYFVGYGPTQIQDVEVHEDGCIEAVTTREIRVFDKSNGLKELHGEAKDRALEAFWAAVDEISNGEN